ncbi:glucosamine-6-phosphate isomerase [Tautonia sociabilis]|uniref:glucosamine-6-phosphate isomerase n=1 Tax=Tautonia sociabilis TaxID=2080755 RepID=UPI001315612C|nr:glucosamine-6-phosphate isomerase [Tautonia sociabilis]
MDPWDLMTIPRDLLGAGTRVRVRVAGDPEALMADLARSLAGVVADRTRAGRPSCLIVPVGPVGQYAHLARMAREEGLDLSGTTIIQMDEYLDPSGRLIDPSHPMSFRGFLNREFYAQLPPDRAPRPEALVCPDPADPGQVGARIRAIGGVDACFGGIGLNGHVAFNEPEPDAMPDEFATRGTRVVDVAPESRAHMAVNLSCALDVIPRRAVTIGMAEILGSRLVRLYANRPWQRGVVRLAVHGPISAACPASLLGLHPDAEVVVSDHVAEPVEVGLR